MSFQKHLLTCGDLSAVIAQRGGELLSLCLSGTELIWQGDPAYWDGSAPLLFPFCGRVKDGVYSYEGNDYSMPIHGFLPSAALRVDYHEKDRLTLSLPDTPESRKIYPFAFRLTLNYQLTQDALTLIATVEAGETELPFSFGAHPGFNLPIHARGFENARLIFPNTQPLSRVEITTEGLLGDGRTTYPLTDGILPLSPDPAGGCGIFFEVPEANRSLTLSSPDLPLDISMEFSDFPVLGLWHAEGAPYLCIEPWQGLPAPQNVPTDLASKPGTLYLAPGDRKTFSLKIRLCQKG